MSDLTEEVKGVTVVRWNPEREAAAGGSDSVGNFGDLLGPLIVRRLTESLPTGKHHRRLLAVGSILHLAEEGDIVWGAGVNGKMPTSAIDVDGLDIRAVRGPRTREILMAKGVDVPRIYGDPALLLPFLFPELNEWARQKTRDVLEIPNLNDLPSDAATREDLLSPIGSPMDIVREIAHARLVIGSSLHAIVVAESLGIPARVIRSGAENYLKYADYYAGTGRSRVRIAADADEAVRLGGVQQPEFDVEALLGSFPSDMWTGGPRDTKASAGGSAHDFTGWVRDAEHTADRLWDVDHYSDHKEVRRRDIVAEFFRRPGPASAGWPMPDTDPELLGRASHAEQEITAVATSEAWEQLTKEGVWDHRIVSSVPELLGLTPDRTPRDPSPRELVGWFAEQLPNYVRLKEILGTDARDMFSTVLRRRLLPAVAEVWRSGDDHSLGSLAGVALDYQREVVPRARLSDEELAIIDATARADDDALRMAHLLNEFDTAHAVATRTGRTLVLDFPDLASLSGLTTALRARSDAEPRVDSDTPGAPELTVDALRATGPVELWLTISYGEERSELPVRVVAPDRVLRAVRLVHTSRDRASVLEARPRRSPLGLLTQR